MKTFSTLLFSFFLLLGLQAQMPGKLQAAMGKTMSGYSTAQTEADFEALSNSFKRIADAEPEQWIPRYYEAHALIIGNFNSKSDAADRDAKLDKAQVALDKLRELEPANSEVEVLQAMLHTSRLVIDPQNRGQEMSAKSGQSVGKAMGLDPTNPRAMYMQLSNDQGMASFFGKDMQEFCDRGEALLAKWDELEGEKTPFAPSWGKDQTESIAKACKK